MTVKYFAEKLDLAIKDNLDLQESILEDVRLPVKHETEGAIVAHLISRKGETEYQVTISFDHYGSQHDDVEKGRWLHKGTERSSKFVCSVCGGVAYYPQATHNRPSHHIGVRIPYQYCPNCQSPMETMDGKLSLLEKMSLGSDVEW